MNIYKYPNTMVKIIGTRHGEKLHETLMNRQEYIFSSGTKKYFLINSDQRDLNYNLYFSEGKKDFNTYQDYTSSNTRQLNLKQTISLLKPLIRNIKNFL
jgi:UDP-glucose 4-epimerase